MPQAVVPWTDLVQAVYQCELDPRLREIAIYRQARAANADYELHQQQLIARNNGVSEAQLKAVLDEHTVASLDPLANLVCQVADELETGATVSDETFEQLYAAFDRRSATELLFILSFYSAVARISNATRIPIEDDNPLQRTSDLTIQR